MLQPKRMKHRKFHRGKRGGVETRGTEVSFGEYGLQALETTWMTARQIEAARRAMVRFIKRGGKIWVRIFPDHPVTQKAAETRMGGGKGAVDHWVAVVRQGRMIFEIAGVTEETARDAMRLAAFKLPIKTQFVVREELLSGSE